MHHNSVGGESDRGGGRPRQSRYPNTASAAAQFHAALRGDPDIHELSATAPDWSWDELRVGMIGQLPGAISTGIDRSGLRGVLVAVCQLRGRSIELPAKTEPGIFAMCEGSPAWGSRATKGLLLPEGLDLFVHEPGIAALVKLQQEKALNFVYTNKVLHYEPPKEPTLRTHEQVTVRWTLMDELPIRRREDAGD